ncbi:unnamed protein product [Arabis nemorensis]|uniref:Uncharacterized protein n=1 Tax=Arabis nemorensis TaxID=586526 RepID=A0A565CMK0_9BRAS|nr:unnamed protein product [Arabis nemorensis]
MNRPRKKKELSLMEELKERNLIEEGEIVDIPDIENEDLIEESSLSVIVRCLNPTVHKIGGLVKALPPIWGMEDRVTGRGSQRPPNPVTKEGGSGVSASSLGRVDKVELNAKNSTSLEYVRAQVLIKADEPLQY